MKLKIITLHVALAGAVIISLLLSCIITFNLITGVHPWTVAKILFTIALLLAEILIIGTAWQINRLLVIISHNQIFTQAAIQVTTRIRRLLTAIGTVLIATLPFVYVGVQVEDAPGLMLMAGGVIIIPFVVALLIAVIEQVLTSAVELKKDNQLTI